MTPMRGLLISILCWTPHPKFLHERERERVRIPDKPSGISTNIHMHSGNVLLRLEGLSGRTLERKYYREVQMLLVTGCH
jgi:hypothetical protein